MSTYREIIGKKIKKVSSDPSSGIDGEMWYNSTTKSIRGLAISNAWRSGTSLSTARTLGGISGGTADASLAYAGYTGPANVTNTESWNGSGWSTGGAVNTARRGGAGIGVQTAALLCGGYSTTPTTFVEEYNGTSWSEETNIPADLGAGAGIQTAALIFSGTTAVSYDGTNWTSSPALPTAMVGGTGIQTAALATIPPPSGTTTLEWDGASWATGGALNTARPSGLGGMTSGIQTSAIIAGTTSAPPPARVGGITEQYDGSSWTTNPATMGTARHTYMTSAANNTSAMIAGGASPYSAATEEFNSTTNLITAGAWASGGAMTTARTGLASAGTQTANVFIGGQMSNSPNAPLNTVELYNGTSWSSNPNNAPYSASNNCGTGTQTAALSWGGYPNITTTLEFDGSSFSTGGALSTGRELTSNNIGVQTAAVAASGFQRPGTYPTQSEEYNGTAWTGGGAVNTPRYSAAGAGTETAAVISGGIEPGQLTATEEYNGSSWTSVTARPYAAGNAGTSGTQTDSLVYGGNPGGALTTTLGYDGTSWSTRPSMAQARAMMGSSAGGTSTAALASSGAAPTATEEFTGSTTTANIKDFTATQS